MGKKSTAEVIIAYKYVYADWCAQAEVIIAYKYVYADWCAQVQNLHLTLKCYFYGL